MCVFVAMNLLYLLSKCGLISCDYILHYYVCGCKLVWEVVNYYDGLQLLVLLSFVYCSQVLMSGLLLDDWVHTGRCISILIFHSSIHIHFELVVFDILWFRIRFRVRSFHFQYHFVLKCKSEMVPRLFWPIPTIFNPRCEDWGVETQQQ